MSSLADETPEGRSIVEICRTRYGADLPEAAADGRGRIVVEFSATTRMSGVDLAGVATSSVDP